MAIRSSSSNTKRWIVWQAVVATLVGAACKDAPATAKPHVIRLIVSSAGGADYRELSREYTLAVPTIALHPYEATSTLGALEALERDKADIGFLMADLTYLAFAGRLEGQSSPFSHLRAIFASGTLPLHLLARDDAKIGSVSDLPGHTVAIGVPGSTVTRITAATLAAFGVPLTSIHAERMTNMSAAEAIRSGSLQAMFVIGAYPGAYPAEAVSLALQPGEHLVSIGGSAAARLREKNRYIRLATIPGGTYVQQPNPIATVGVQNLLVCRRDLDEQVVYELTKGFFSAIPQSSALVNSFRFMDLDQAAATPIPLHDGAARYYRERELFQ